MAVHSTDDLIRMSSEVAMFVGAFLYLLAAVREAGFLGLQMFIENLVSILKVILYALSVADWRIFKVQGHSRKDRDGL